MARSTTKELFTPFENLESAFRSKSRLFETPGLVESSSPELDLFFDIEEHSNRETTGIMTETMEQYMNKARAIPTKTAADAKIAIQEMVEYSQKWHNGTSSKTRSTKTSDRLPAIKSQLNNIGREIKKVNEKVYAAQDCPLKEEENTLEEAYYTQFGAPYQPAGQYRAAGP
nr:hypothetical protein [Tanacetum cinerariifolium]